MRKVPLKKVLIDFHLANKLKGSYGSLKNLKDYKKIYFIEKRKLRKLSEEELFRKIKDKKRRERYKKLKWYVGKVNLREMGVWPRMSHIQDNLLIKDAGWSSNKIYSSSGELLKGQINHLFRILPFINFLNKRIPIILVKGGLIRKRKPYQEQKYDIDDGCHRAICLGLINKKKVHCFIGR